MKRYSVFFKGADGKSKYLAGTGRRVAWTTDFSEAAELARGLHGKVVDADKFITLFNAGTSYEAAIGKAAARRPA